MLFIQKISLFLIGSNPETNLVLGPVYKEGE